MKYLTLKQVADKFGVCTKTISKLAKNHKIPHTCALGCLRFPEAVLDHWAQNPDQVVSEWFQQEVTHGGIDDGNETTGAHELGRSLFLRGCSGD
jgi:predicted DNA-binding transcriptional regulator AlpA